MRNLITCLIVTFPVFAHAQEGMRASDQIILASDLETRLSGSVIEFFDGSKSRFGRDGVYGYTYTDDGPVWSGLYRVAGDSEVCVDFDNGSARCDLLVETDGRLVLITADGTRFPVRNFTVDDS